MKSAAISLVLALVTLASCSKSIAEEHRDPWYLLNRETGCVPFSEMFTEEEMMTEQAKSATSPDDLLLYLQQNGQPDAAMMPFMQYLTMVNPVPLTDEEKAAYRLFTDDNAKTIYFGPDEAVVLSGELCEKLGIFEEDE